MSLNCPGIKPLLNYMKSMLEEAEQLGVSGHPSVIAAQAFYDEADSYYVFMPRCDQNTAEAQATIDRLAVLLNSNGGNVPPPPGPLAPSDELIPGWVKFVLVGGLVVYGLATLRTFMPPQRRLAGRNRRRR